MKIKVHFISEFFLFFFLFYFVVAVSQIHPNHHSRNLLKHLSLKIIYRHFKTHLQISLVTFMWHPIVFYSSCSISQSMTFSAACFQPPHPSPKTNPKTGSQISWNLMHIYWNFLKHFLHALYHRFLMEKQKKFSFLKFSLILEKV